MRRLPLLLLVACGGNTSVSPDAGSGSIDSSSDSAIMDVTASTLSDCPAPGATEIVATIENKPERFALFASNGSLYYGYSTFDVMNPTPWTGAIRRVRRNGGPITTIASSYIAGRIVTDGIDVFFLEASSMPAGQGYYAKRTGIYAIPLAGGSLRELPQPPNTSEINWMIASSGPQSVSWTSDNSATSRVAHWNGASTSVVATVPQKGDYSFIADETRIYWLADDGKLVAQPIAGGQPTKSANPVGDILIAQDATNVYVSGNTSEIRSVAKSNQATTDLASVTWPDMGLADDGWVYFVDEKWTIQRVRATGGARETFATHVKGFTEIQALAADACAIYWTVVISGSDGSVTSTLMRKGK